MHALPMRLQMMGASAPTGASVTAMQMQVGVGCGPWMHPSVCIKATGLQPLKSLWATFLSAASVEGAVCPDQLFSDSNEIQMG